MERIVPIQTRPIFPRALSLRPEFSDRGVTETTPPTQEEFMFGPGGGDYVGINSYDSRLPSPPETARIT